MAFVAASAAVGEVGAFRSLQARESMHGYTLRLNEDLAQTLSLRRFAEPHEASYAVLCDRSRTTLERASSRWLDLSISVNVEGWQGSRSERTTVALHERSTSMPTITEVIRSRRSPRAFLPDPVPGGVIREVLEDARWAPSHSNTQPWTTHIVSGPARDALSTALLEAHDAGQRSPDFTETYGSGVHLERSQHLAAATYGARGIAREDHEGRNEVVRENLRFYGAPHAAMLFVPQLGDGVRAASDVGMYAQNFLLSLHGRGYQGIPQAVHGMYAETVRSTLCVPSDHKLLSVSRSGPLTQPHPCAGSTSGAYRWPRALSCMTRTCSTGVALRRLWTPSRRGPSPRCSASGRPGSARGTRCALSSCRAARPAALAVPGRGQRPPWPRCR